MTGSKGSVFLLWNADSQSLLLAQRLTTRVQRAEVTVMRRRGGDEVIQQEMKWEGDAWEHHQQEEHYLVTSKAISLSQNVLKRHLQLENMKYVSIMFSIPNAG